MPSMNGLLILLVFVREARRAKRFYISSVNLALIGRDFRRISSVDRYVIILAFLIAARSCADFYWTSSVRQFFLGARGPCFVHHARSAERHRALLTSCFLQPKQSM